jgi:hypothetical protein
MPLSYQPLQIRIRVVEQLWPAPPVPVGLGVPQDRQQPGPRVPPVEPIHRPVGPQQRALYQVLGVGNSQCVPGIPGKAPRPESGSQPIRR